MLSNVLLYVVGVSIQTITMVEEIEKLSELEKE